MRVPAAALVASDAIPLQVTGLARHYGRLVGLAHFDLELGPGQCVALIGANGSGKSTAVRTISGQLEPTEGTVRVCGHDPHREPDAEAARAALALVPDAPMLYDDLTVRQHLSLVALAARPTTGSRSGSTGSWSVSGSHIAPTSCPPSCRAVSSRRPAWPVR